MDEFFNKFAEAVDTGVNAIRKVYEGRTQVETVKANARLANQLIDLQRQALTRQATLAQLQPQPIQVPFSSWSAAGAPAASSAPMDSQKLLIVAALALGALLLVRT